MNKQSNVRKEKQQLYLDSAEVEQLVNDTNSLNRQLHELINQYKVAKTTLNSEVNEYVNEGDANKTIEILVGPSKSSSKTIDLSKYGKVVKVYNEPVSGAGDNSFYITLDGNRLTVQNNAYEGENGLINSNSAKVVGYPNGWAGNLILKGLAASNFAVNNVKVTESVADSSIWSANNETSNMGVQYLGTFKNTPDNKMMNVDLTQYDNNKGGLEGAFDSCHQFAVDYGYEYFGIGNAQSHIHEIAEGTQGSSFNIEWNNGDFLQSGQAQIITALTSSSSISIVSSKSAGTWLGNSPPQWTWIYVGKTNNQYRFLGHLIEQPYLKFFNIVFTQTNNTLSILCSVKGREYEPGTEPTSNPVIIEAFDNAIDAPVASSKDTGGYGVYDLVIKISNPLQSSNVAVQCSVTNDVNEAVQNGTPTSGWGVATEPGQVIPGTNIPAQPANKVCSTSADGFKYGGHKVGAFYESRSPNPSVKKWEYLGGYGDRWDRAIPEFMGNTTWDECKQYAEDKGYNLFGRQDGGSDDWGQCFIGNDWDRAIEYGRVNNIVQTDNGYMMGGGWANAVYGVVEEPSAEPIPEFQGCYNVSDDALGFGNGGFIVASNYNIEQCNAEAVKRGFAYFSVSGVGGAGSSQCSVGDNIIEAQKQGAPKVTVMDESGKVYGGNWANALYKVNNPGKPELVGKFGYVDMNNELKEYPSSMIKNNALNNNPKTGCPNDFVEIDSITWSNFSKGAPMDPNTMCGLKKEINEERNKINGLEQSMNKIVTKINQNITKLKTMNADLNEYSMLDKIAIQNNLSNYSRVTRQITNVKKQQNDTDGRIKDTEINVKSENSLFIMWLVICIFVLIFVYRKLSFNK